MPSLAALAIATVTMVTAMADAPAQGGPQGTPAGGKSPVIAGQANESQGEDLGNPATWTLPIEAYLPTGDHMRSVSTMKDRFVDQCMSRAGYAAWEPAPALPAIGGKTVTDWRYGIHDMELASKRGYRPAAAEEKAYSEAVEAGGVDETTGDGPASEALSACASTANRNAPDVESHSELAQRISGEAFIKSQEAPSVVAVFAKWSACMDERGFTYGEPMEANDDTQFSDPETVSDKEINTATADIACRNQHNVARVWFDAETALQKQYISEHAADLQKGRTALIAEIGAAKK